jgi:hypothetical protein
MKPYYQRVKVGGQIKEMRVPGMVQDDDKKKPKKEKKEKPLTEKQLEKYNDLRYNANSTGSTKDMKKADKRKKKLGLSIDNPNVTNYGAGYYKLKN